MKYQRGDVLLYSKYGEAKPTEVCFIVDVRDGLYLMRTAWDGKSLSNFTTDYETADKMRFTHVGRIDFDSTSGDVLNVEVFDA